MSDCLVCIEPFNKSTRKPVTCPYCATAICRTCIQTCLLQENTPHCQIPECKKAWSDDFLSLSLTKVWLDSEYRRHREKVLLDLEKARLPETQEQAAIYINAKALVADIKPRIKALEEQKDALPIAQERKRLRTERLNYDLPRDIRDQAYKRFHDLHPEELKESRGIRSQIRKLRSEAYKVAVHHVGSYGAPQVGVGDVRTTEKKWTFVGKCPKSECQGYVGMDYACGLCNAKVCKDCMEPKEAEHACNTDNVLNVRALRKEAKPCPKCAAMISKIDGCDQMWCTQCRTAFSWRTGAEETVVHNPHFYEWMRRTGQHMAPGAVNVAPREVGPCGFPNVWRGFQAAVRNAYPDGAAGWRPYRARDQPTEKVAIADKLAQILNDTGHVTNVILAGLNGTIRHEVATETERKRVLRVRRLANEITEDEWKKPLESMERASKRRHAMRDIYDMYSQAAMTLMGQFTQEDISKKASWERDEIARTLFAQYEQLVKYVNEELRKVRNRFSATVYDVPAFVAPVTAVAAATP